MISTTDNKKMFNGSGTTGPFTFDFRFFYNTEIHVVKTSTSGVDTELTENVGYTLSGAGSYSGGSVTLSSALASGEKLTIYRDVELVQPVDLRNKGAFFAEIHEDVFDRMTMVGQQLKEQIDRCAKLPITNDTDADELVADILMLANNKAELDVLYANINDIQTVAADLNEPVSEINTVAGSIDNVNTVGGNITNVNTVAGNTTNINTVSGISGNVTTVAGISGNVTTVAGISANVTAVANNATNINAVNANKANIDAVAGNNTNITAVAGNATNINAVNANKTNIDTVAGKATEVTTVAGIAGNVTTVAGISANVTAVANNSSNINAVAGNATNINAVNANKANIDTVAGDKANIDAVAGDKANIDAVAYDLTTINAVHANKANIDLVAGDKSNIDAVADDLATINAVHANKTNIDAVAGNNTNITAVAGNATNINLVAGDKANIDSVAGDLTNINAVNANKANIDTVAGISSNVTTVAGISSSVVTAATNVTAINDYSKVWLGGKASDPTLRNDGSALQTGDQYFNTGTNKVRVYSTGTAVWVDSGITFSPTVERFSGTGSQTAFTLSSSPGTAMALIINISGVVQTPTVDYTVSGTTLTFTTAPPSGTNNITVQNFGSAGVINVPADGSVTTSKIVDGSVTAAKMATGAAVGNIANNTITPAMHSNSGYEFGMRNRIINGAMMIDQRNAGASVTPTNGSYNLDRWAYFQSQASKFTCQQNQGSVTPPVGFTKYLGFTSSSAYSVVSGDYFAFQQSIEGFNVADLAWGTASAKTVTLSFWARSSLTGQFGGSLKNLATSANRSYAFSYTISSANTWEYKTITIAGDTGGSWATDNSVGLCVCFDLGTEATYLGAAGSWAGTNYLGATGDTKVVSTNGATFYITGVQLEKGSVATPFEFRQYGQELALCQRYLPAVNNSNGSSIGNLGVGFAGSSTLYYGQLAFPVPTRVPPTGVTVNSASYFTANPFGIGGGAASAVTFSTASSNTARLILTTTGLTTGSGGDWYMNNTAANLYLTGCEL